MVPGKKRRLAIDSKVIQLKARTRDATQRALAAKAKARAAKEQSKQARKLFKQAKQIANRARNELHALSKKLKTLIGSGADKVGNSVKPGKRDRPNMQAAQRIAPVVATQKRVKGVRAAAKRRKAAGKRSAVVRGKTAKPVAPKKHVVAKKRSVRLVRAPVAVRTRRRATSTSVPAQLPPVVSVPLQTDEPDSVAGNEPVKDGDGRTDEQG